MWNLHGPPYTNQSPPGPRVRIARPERELRHHAKPPTIRRNRSQWGFDDDLGSREEASTLVGAEDIRMHARRHRRTIRG